MGESTSSELLQAAIREIKQGDLDSGRQTLSKVIKNDPNSVYAEKAWVWMSATFSDSDQKRKCLENALKINPDNEIAQKGLTKLPSPIPPEEVEEATEFEYPEWLSDAPEEQLTTPSTLKKNRPTSEMVQKTTQPRKKSDQQLIDAYIAFQTARGWQIVSYTATSVQLRKPKHWSKAGLILGLVLLFFWGTGLFVLLLAVVDYLLQKEEVIFVTVEELKDDTLDRNSSYQNSVTSNNDRNNFVTLLKIIGLGFIALIGCSLLSALLSSLASLLG